MGDRIKLLIVDDEVQFLNTVSERLEMRGLEVSKAANGAEALALARTEKFDIALVDLKMPGIDGMQLLQILKEEHRYLEVVILTGHGSLDSAVQATKHGAFGYLPKPYELDKLLQTLREAYEARLRKKFEADEKRLEEIQRLAETESPLGILRALKALDDEVK